MFLRHTARSLTLIVGKSSLISLIPRLREFSGGKICIEDKALADYDVLTEEEAALIDQASEMDSRYQFIYKHIETKRNEQVGAVLHPGTGCGAENERLRECTHHAGCDTGGAHSELLTILVSGEAMVEVVFLTVMPPPVVWPDSFTVWLTKDFFRITAVTHHLVLDLESHPLCWGAAPRLAQLVEELKRDSLLGVADDGFRRATPKRPGSVMNRRAAAPD
ncbi:hypothetical protein B0H10DRAFT_1954777 [Mycena sp. CBHHK59/15]|nr:hypothetical protein B0H10DRAFT_1954777 [Mycena sp. CBHHK59/15]